MNFPGRRTYRQMDGYSIRDAVSSTKDPMKGLARGGTNPDYNIKLRGLGQRIDTKPRKPWL